MHSAAFFPSRLRAWVTPTVTVDFPSPAGVGLIPVTSTSRPRGWRRSSAASRTFALYFPYSSISSSSSPSSSAMSATGRGFAAWAMAMSVGTGAHTGLPRLEPLRSGAERMQHDRGPRAGQRRGDVLVRGARVHHARLAQLRGERQLRRERPPLRVARRMVVMVIEPRLPHSHHFG